MPIAEPLFLIGPPASGKTSVGRHLAKRLGVPFCDGDALVAAAGGAPVSELVVHLAPEQFRELQTRVIQQLWKHPAEVISLLHSPTDPYVCAIPSAAVDIAELRTELAKRATCYLDVPFAELFPRTGLNAPRPVGLVPPRALARQLLLERRPRYVDSARWVIETKKLDVAQVALVIEALVSSQN